MLFRSRRFARLLVPFTFVTWSGGALAQSADASIDPSSAPGPGATPPTAGEPIVAPDDPSRTQSVVPQVAVARPPAPPFVVDPVTDGVLIGTTFGFAYILDAINSTGEVRPQQISATFDRKSLLGIDRGAISQTLDSNAGTFSNIGLFAAVGYTVADTVFTGVSEKSVQAGLADALIYGEVMSTTWALTNLAKIAVRRPRPIAYIEREANAGDPNYTNADTDSSLSFFSGHSSMTAAAMSAATYLAFVRSPRSARPWITLVLGSALTAFVGYERVRKGAHFPTDVIAGSIAGAGVGVLVPHLHRFTESSQRRVWIGLSPAGRAPDGQRASGGEATLSGTF